MYRQFPEIKKVYLKYVFTDLRKGTAGLESIIKLHFGKDPMEPGALFLFCGRSCSKMKALIWDNDGFILMKKELSRGRYCWPRDADDLKYISEESFARLLDGFTIDSSIR